MDPLIKDMILVMSMISLAIFLFIVEWVRVDVVAILMMVLVGLAWIPVIQGGRGMYDYLQSVQGYLAPPIFVVFFFLFVFLLLGGDDLGLEVGGDLFVMVLFHGEDAAPTGEGAQV